MTRALAIGVAAAGMLACQGHCGQARGPSEFPASDPATFSDHPELLLPFSRTQTLVLVKEGASAGRVQSQIEAGGAKVVGWKESLGIFLAELPDSGDHRAVDALVTLLERSAEVEAATLVPVLSDAVAPGSIAYYQDSRRWFYQGILNGTGAGEMKVAADLNWGLEFSRLPAVWNLREYLRRHGGPATVLVVESGFDASPDLNLTRLPTASTTPGMHGLGVASVIGATWGNGSGIDGVLPAPLNLIAVTTAEPSGFRNLADKVNLAFGGVPFSFSDAFERLSQALAQEAPVHAVNWSAGYNWYQFGKDPRDPRDAEKLQPSIEKEIAKEAKAFARLISSARQSSPGLLARIDHRKKGPPRGLPPITEEF